MRDALDSPKRRPTSSRPLRPRPGRSRTSPEGGVPVRDHELARKGCRWCLVGSFMAFYTADRERPRVVVERALYGARDWKSLV